PSPETALAIPSFGVVSSTMPSLFESPRRPVLLVNVFPSLVHVGLPVVLGPQRKNVTVPVGSGAFVPPETVIVAVSCTAVPGVMVFPACDAAVASDGLHCGKCATTKSFSTAEVEVEARLSATMLEKHSPASPSVDRLRPAS